MYKRITNYAKTMREIIQARASLTTAKHTKRDTNHRSQRRDPTTAPNVDGLVPEIIIPKDTKVDSLSIPTSYEDNRRRPLLDHISDIGLKQ